MSVYIPGMEMPKNCDCCDFMEVRGEYGEPDCPFGLIIRCASEKHPDCPLIPVPDHGRLGDLDAAIEKLKRLREYHSDDSQSGVFIAHGISQCIEVLTGKEAPAIIPADKEVEG